ncbi:hypothetical protein FAM21834_00513 [Lentilactobacillus parabuchneri]|uniref:DUF5776 domain-containing protein n=2 Tax=Lentilactobacillus parabuchneri TaxID=152331 RepID=A0A1X1FGM9_9LACO|nr:DUF5776 domain-containing protein [Lentilactobacillus parabuchneri]APR06787.1 hypothetical protein FAM21731_00574 [Lentilactobacillus parabuchneri]MBW0222599.1 hypothetical protein [Lentilactobacillus parabuchneri]MBW0245813.1 hypothetical protein [Lentilactobacillus parabuchneri]MBW0264504.1 hypothetical protein [Lentilactobacillus parabuchneri]MDG9736322.1 DUF5776 domain-containing protein [Lentilactobacillus parabuchneri]
MKKQIRIIGHFALLLGVFGLFGLFGLNNARADSSLYNGAAPRYTTPAKYSNGLEHAVYISANGDNSNYGGSSRQTLINNDVWKLSNKPYFYEHLYLKNSNPTGGADISVAQFLRFPKDLSGGSAPFLPVGDPATAAVITGGTLGQFTITKPYGNSNIVINGSLKPQQSIDVAVPLAYDGIGLVYTNAYYEVRENNWEFDGTSLYFRVGLPIDVQTYPDFMKGQYLVTYKDQDGYYRQATDVQPLMPQFNLENDIEIDNVNKGLGTNDGTTLFSNATYRVLGDQMSANNGQPFWDMLQSRGYAPVWTNRLLTYESFTAGYPGGSTPTDPDYFKYMRDILNHNGIGGINWQVVKVLVADNATVTRNTKWNPLDHVTLYDPKQQNNSTATEIPVTKDNVKVTSNNGHINSDGTLDTSTPGVYNVTYTYEAVYSDSVKRTISKTIQVTVPGGSHNNGGSSTNSNAGNENGGSGNSSWNPTTPSNPNGTGLPNYAAVKGAAVYATKTIYLYKDATFRKTQRIVKYPKVKQTDRPMFVVTGYSRSNGGALRYKVRDVNHKSKTAGKVGYITANRNYVENVYYQSARWNKKITVIAKNGIHAYKNKNLTGRTKTYKKWTILNVKRLVKHNLTTRYQLKNGDYVTANKKLVIEGESHRIVVMSYKK